MWLGLALIAWLWGLALYLVTFYAVKVIWSADELHSLLGQDFYNAHIPTGGWWAAWQPTLVFLIALAIVGLSTRAVRAGADRAAHRFHLPGPLARAVCTVLLIALVVPAVAGATTWTRARVEAAIQRAQYEEALKLQHEAEQRDPFFTGAGMAEPVLSFGADFERLHLGADGAYRYSYWSWCGSCPSGAYEGRYSRADGELVLTSPEQSEELERHFREIEWGQRRYLVNDESLVRFANEVNAGTEPRSTPEGRFLLEVGGESRAIAGTPSLPGSAAELLLAAPLSGHVVEVAGDHTSWIDLGERAGVRPGMLLFTPEAPTSKDMQRSFGRESIVEPLEVLEIQASRSRVRPYVHRGFELPVGLRVSSRKPAEE